MRKEAAELVWYQPEGILAGAVDGRAGVPRRVRWSSRSENRARFMLAVNYCLVIPLSSKKRKKLDFLLERMVEHVHQKLHRARSR
jgi:hypothetical protein